MHPLKGLKKFVGHEQDVLMRQVFFSTIISNKDKKNESVQKGGDIRG